MAEDATAVDLGGVDDQAETGGVVEDPVAAADGSRIGKGVNSDVDNGSVTVS